MIASTSRWISRHIAFRNDSRSRAFEFMPPWARYYGTRIRIDARMASIQAIYWRITESDSDSSSQLRSKRSMMLYLHGAE
jgi:hypothetical protein